MDDLTKQPGVFGQTRWPTVDLDEEWVHDEQPLLTESLGHSAVRAPPTELHFDLSVPAAPGAPIARYALIGIYGSHLLEAWAWRTWEFAVALVLMELYPQSLLVVSLYGLLDDLLRVLLGASIGAYVDRTSRLKGATTMLLWQNVCIATSALAAGGVLWHVSPVDGINADVHYMALLALTVVAGGSAGVGAVGSSIAVEREWAKQLCGCDAAALSRVNAGMKAIDLSCKMLAPLVAGLLMTYAGMRVTVLVIAGFALAAWLPECALLRIAQQHSPALQQPKAVAAADFASAAKQGRRPWHDTVGAWRLYSQQSVALPGVALALLYLTVLSMGFLMTAYLKWRGLTEAWISVFRAVGGMAGLLATAVFPRAQHKLGLEATGSLGITQQLACLIVAVVPAVLLALHAATAIVTPTVAVIILLSGLVASRTGLWLFDMAVTQMFQDQVAQGELGSVSGVQSSLQSSFEIVSFAVGAAAPQPEQFTWLMVGSLAVVAAATALYHWHLLRGRARYKLIVDTSQA